MLQDLLRARADRIHGRWTESALADYPIQARKAWRRERDRFANPVGHSLRTGLRAILDALLGDGDPARVRESLDEIVRIRAVQPMSAPEAVGFVFRLKDAVRAEVRDSGREAEVQDELPGLERRIDELALTAFDLYTGHRERLGELRIAELKRNIPWAAIRAGPRAAPDPGAGERKEELG